MLCFELHDGIDRSTLNSCYLLI